MSINPSALLVWVLAALIGYLYNGVDGAVAGAAIALGISLLVTVIDAFWGRS